MARKKDPWGKTVLVDFDDGIAWVTLNRPEKRNAMSPKLNEEMRATVEALATDPTLRRARAHGRRRLVRRRHGLEGVLPRDRRQARHVILKVRRTAEEWQWRRLRDFPKATIAMVNGWCFGGAFTPMVACDLAIAADEATFGLSEVNWGIIPAGNVTKATSETIGLRNALFYAMTGETVQGQAEPPRWVSSTSPCRARSSRSARREARAHAARQESNRAARHQDRDEAHALHGLGRVGRLSVREDGRSVVFRRRATTARTR